LLAHSAQCEAVILYSEVPLPSIRPQQVGKSARGTISASASGTIRAFSIRVELRGRHSTS
jgi:hypothetical protein